MSMATFHLQIVTPDRKIFDGPAEKIILRTVAGDVCILARHIDYAVPLGIGEARVTDGEGNTRVAACNGGLLSVSNNEVRVMAITFEWQDEIDLARAKEAEERNQTCLESITPQFQENRGVFYTHLLEIKLSRLMVQS